ncbi:MAG TPA: cyclic nucleotide-binding domain-containing protein [Kofleriaceae bacterium]|nr:cyclic nucleotide-binding domain-containing protein [Kofleriaceae bacterium]
MSEEAPAPDTPASALGRAAARLLRQPNDLGSWWEVCATLARVGRPDQAAAAHGQLGRAASALGHPALAVACARALDQAGDKRAAADLTRHIAREHAIGSKRVDPARRATPPPPPPTEPTQPGALPDPPADLDGAAELADKAVRAAAAAARSRTPDSLAPTPLIGVLEQGEVRNLCSIMQLRLCAGGEVIVDVGQPATALFWIARGAAEVTREGQHLGELRSNQFFGEIALVSGTTRTARVAAFGPAVVLEIPAHELEKLAARAPRLARVLAQYARTRLLASVMRMSELFSRLTDEEHERLLPLFDTELFEVGDVVVENGSPNQRLYVVASGSCQVKNGEHVLATLGPGDGIGEMSLLARRPANFDVVATERTVALSLSREAFDVVAVNHPGLLAEVYKLLVQRESQNEALVHDANDLVV